MEFVQNMVLLNEYISQVIFGRNSLNTPLFFLFSFPLILECLKMIRNGCMSLTLQGSFCCVDHTVGDGKG